MLLHSYHYDSVIQHFNMTVMENVSEPVIKVNPNTVTPSLALKSAVRVGYMVSVREKYDCNNIIFSPEFLRKSKTLYDNGYLTKSVAILWAMVARKTIENKELAT